MQLQIAKWGNSLAVRLPVTVTKQLHIHDGDSLELNLNKQGELVLTPAKSFDKVSFMQNISKLNDTLPSTTYVMDTLRNNERY
jgi:antitoxin MazE